MIAWRREQALAANDGLGEVEEFAISLLGVASEHVEGLLVVDRVSRHEDAFARSVTGLVRCLAALRGYSRSAQQHVAFPSNAKATSARLWADLRASDPIGRGRASNA